MLEDFDPKEKKVIIIFIALLLLGIVYVGTHNLQINVPEEEKINPVPVNENSLSGKYL